MKGFIKEILIAIIIYLIGFLLYMILEHKDSTSFCILHIFYATTYGLRYYFMED